MAAAISPKKRVTAAIVVGVAGLLFLTTLLLLLQPYDPRNVPVLGRWSYSYFGLSVSFALLGGAILLLHRLGKSTPAANLSLMALGIYFVLIPLEIVSHTGLMGAFRDGLYGFLWHIPNPSVRKSVASNCGYTTSKDFRQFNTLPCFLPKPGILYRERIPVDRGISKWVNLKLDREGFNSLPRPAGLDRVDTVCVGDSFCFGLVEREFNYCSVAMEITGRSVLNLGIAGFGPQQAGKVMADYGLKRAPQRVVWQFYGNDLLDAANVEYWLERYGDRSWFQFLGDIGKSTWWYEGDLNQERTWIYFPDLALGVVSQLRHRLFRAEDKNLQQTLKVLMGDKGYLRLARADFLAQGVRPPADLNEWVEQGAFDRRGGRIEFSVSLERVLEIIDRELSEAARACARIGAELILMPIPGRGFVYSREIVEFGLREEYLKAGASPLAPPGYGDGLFFQWLQQAAQRHGIVYWDLPGHLRREARKPDSGLFCYALDKHLNRSGNLAVGRYMAAKIGDVSQSP